MSPAEVRLELVGKGYEPLPLKGKAPVLDGWHKRNGTSPGDIEIWSKLYAYAENTGVLTKHTPTLDIDILDPEAAAAVEALVRERFEERAYVLIRFGRSPKRAVPFRTNDPFRKITIDLIAPDGSLGQKLEMLGDGQQVVVHGIHPDTGKAYAWFGGDLWHIAHDELPYISFEEAQALVGDAAELVCRERGYRRPEKRKRASGKPGTGNGGADWSHYLGNLHDHDSDAGFAMALLCSGMSDGAAVNFLRDAVAALEGIDAERKQRRLKEIPGLVKSAREKLEAEAPAATTAPSFSDEALALTFAERHAGWLRYVALWGQWLSWAETHWGADTTLHAFDLARQIAREIAATCNTRKIAVPLASAKTVAAVERLAKADRRLAATDDQWDGRATDFNMPTGE
jgi:hypothetical protein